MAQRLLAVLFLSALPADHAGWVAAAQLQDAIFAAAVASHCLLVLTVPPARVFAGVTPEPGCPTRGTGRENPGRESLRSRRTTASLLPARPRRRLIQSRESLRRLQHIIREKEFPIRR